MSSLIPARLTTELVQCKLCHGSFLEPRLLPCLHSYCTPCLKKLHDQQGSVEHLLECPQCHHTSDPMGDVTTFKCNALIQNGNKKTIDKKMMQSCLNCKNRSKTSSAVVWCVQCMEYYCGKCDKEHRKSLDDDNQHTTQSIKTLKGNPSFNMTLKKNKHMCPVHVKKALDSFCLICQLSLCAECKETEHASHTSRELSAFANESREALKATLKEMPKRQKFYQDTADAWTTYESDVRDSVDRIRAELYDYRRQIDYMIEHWYEAECQRIDRALEREQHRITKQLEETRNIQEAIQSAHLYGSAVSSTVHDSQVAVLHATVMERVSQLLMAEPQPPTKPLLFRLRRQTQTIGADMFGSVAITQDAIKNGKCEEISDGEESVKSSEKSASIKRCNKTMTTFKVASASDRSDPWLTGVSARLDDRLLIADHRNNSVKVYTIQGQLEKTIQLSKVLTGKKRFKQAQSLWDVAAIDNSRMITASSDGLHLFNMDGELIATINSTDEFGSLAMVSKPIPTENTNGDANNNDGTYDTIVSEDLDQIGQQKQLLAYNETLGKVHLYAAETEMSRKDDAGADWRNCRLLRSFPVYDKPMIGFVSKVCGDTHGNVYACDVKQDRIKMYSPDGTYIKPLGSHGTGDGQLLRPRGVNVDRCSGIITVVDHGNNRLSTYDSSGKFQQNILTKDGHAIDSPSGITRTHKGQLVVVTSKGYVHLVY